LENPEMNGPDVDGFIIGADFALIYLTARSMKKASTSYAIFGPGGLVPTGRAASAAAASLR
jgi:hypothetical protein